MAIPGNNNRLKDLLDKVLSPTGGSNFTLSLVVSTGALLLATVVVIGVVLALVSFLGRHVPWGSGAGFEGLRTIETNATVYATIYTPQSGGSINRKGDGCNHSNGTKVWVKTLDGSLQGCGRGFSLLNDNLLNRSDVEIGTKFTAGIGKDKYVPGGIAVINANASKECEGWPGGTVFPMNRYTAAGNTHWLTIPGYNNNQAAPVVDSFGECLSSTYRAKALEYALSGINIKSRVDLMDKTIQDVREIEENFKTLGFTNERGFWKITGVTVQFGNPFAGQADDGAGFSHTPQKFPRFSQSKGPWGSKPYGSCGTIGEAGCAPSAIAAIIKYYQEQGVVNVNTIDKKIYERFGDRVDPEVIATLSAERGFRVCGEGTSTAMPNDIGGLYGLKVSSEVTWEAAVIALEQRIPVIAGVRGLPFSPSDAGHVLVITGVDQANNKVYFSDSSGRNNTETSIETFRDHNSWMKIVSPKPEIKLTK